MRWDTMPNFRLFEESAGKIRLDMYFLILSFSIKLAKFNMDI